MQFSVPALLFLISALLAGSVSVLVWPRRRIAGAVEVFWLLVWAAFWAVTAGLEVAVRDTGTKILWSQISYGGIGAVPVLYLLFALKYTRPDWKRSRQVNVLATMLAAVIWGIAWTNGWHHQLWTGFTPIPGRNAILYGHGWAFFTIIGVLYVLATVASLILLHHLVVTPKQYRGQLLPVVAGCLLPFGTSVIYITGLSPIPGVDPTPISFALSSALFGLGILQFGLFDLVPVARGEVLDRLETGVVVIDRSGRVIDLNRAAERMMASTSIALGSEVGDPLRTWLASQPPRNGSEPTVSHVEHLDRSIEVLSSPLGPGRHEGDVVLLRDVTERQRTERELVVARATLIERVLELERAIGQVHQLHQLLPICSYCGLIRNDKDYWERLDSYLASHSELRFSHGICPDCYQKVSTDFVPR